MYFLLDALLRRTYSAIDEEQFKSKAKSVGAAAHDASEDEENNSLARSTVCALLSFVAFTRPSARPAFTSQFCAVSLSSLKIVYEQRRHARTSKNVTARALAQYEALTLRTAAPFYAIERGSK